jgi:hypothetical protein
MIGKIYGNNLRLILFLLNIEMEIPEESFSSPMKASYLLLN